MLPVEQALERFLADSSLKVMAIKGDWGAGKTYFWKQFIKERSELLSEKKYAYASLFGAESIADVRSKVFCSVAELGAESKEKWWADWGAAVKKLVSGALKHVNIPYLTSTKAISEMLENRLVKDLLVCFDDFERKEDSLTAAAFMGYVSQLKEEKCCKIVLIFNDQEFNSKAKSQIAEYREKVVDLEVEYCPSVEQNLAIIWPKGCPRQVAEVFHAFDLNNIRVMQRVKWTVDYFREAIGNEYPNLQEAFEAKCAVIAVVYYAFSERLSLEKLLKTNIITDFLDAEDGDDEQDRDRIKAGLSRVLYIPNEIDPVIVEYLEKGFVDTNKHRSILARRDDRQRRSKIESEYTEVWRACLSNFSCSEDDCIGRMEDMLKSHANEIGVNYVETAVEFIKKIQPSKDLSDQVTASIDAFVEAAVELESDRMSLIGISEDSAQKIRDGIAARSSPKPLDELFEAVAGGSSWSPGDVRKFERHSENEIFTWIETSRANVVELLRCFLRRFRVEEDAKYAVDAVDKALATLSERSSLDKYRVKRIIEGRD